MRTTLQATGIGPIAYRALKNKTGRAGEVANSFPKSFYIRTFNDELVFVTGLPVKSPITINLDSPVDFDHLAKPRGRVFLNGTDLRIGDDLAIDLHGVPTQPNRPELSASKIGQLREALYIGTAILTIVDTYQSVLDHASIAYRGAEKFFRTGILSLRDTEGSEVFLETAKSIVGLGTGFTPSGDDVLGGFLCTYNSLSRTVGYHRVMMDFQILKKNTNWISAKLVDYMQHGVCDDQVAQLVNSAASADEDEFVLALETLLPRGHASGIDISTGVVLAVSLLRDLANNQHETETIIRRLGLSYK